MNVIPEFIKAAQAAEKLCVAPNTLANWRYNGIGPVFYKFSGAVRYRVADVDAYIAHANRQVTA